MPSSAEKPPGSNSSTTVLRIYLRYYCLLCEASHSGLAEHGEHVDKETGYLAGCCILCKARPKGGMAAHLARWHLEEGGSAAAAAAAARRRVGEGPWRVYRDRRAGGEVVCQYDSARGKRSKLRQVQKK